MILNLKNTMAKLLYESKLNAAMEDIINDADSHIIFMCPYFKLHDRLKDCLKHKKNTPEIKIVIVFGKNEDDPSKSMNKKDFEFLKSFPNVVIKYEKRLHAKFFANEKFGLVTSINLHSYSIDNNIEVGVSFKTKSLLKDITDKVLNPITSKISDTENIAEESFNFFIGVSENAEKIFERKPKYESKIFGLQKNYLESETIVDKSVDFFNGISNNFANQNFKKAFNSYSNSSHEKNLNSFGNRNRNSYEAGYCIRTREQIAFDLSRPLSRDAYYVWAEFSNPDYRESFCHSCGREWETSVRYPLCNNCN